MDPLTLFPERNFCRQTTEEKTTVTRKAEGNPFEKRKAKFLSFARVSFCPLVGI